MARVLYVMRGCGDPSELPGAVGSRIMSSAAQLIPESVCADSRTQRPVPVLHASERRNEAAVWCENLHMAAPDIRDSDDDLAELLPDGQWHVTICQHCGAAVEHTTVNPAYVEIAQALHAFGHCA